MIFRDDFYFLSNMYPCPVVVDGIEYSCSETAFQAQKTFNASERKMLINLDGFAAKKAGKHVTLRPDWESVKILIMEAVVRAKFEQHPELMIKLHDVAGTICEDNSWGDTFWGVCNGNGENHLGKILMKIRDEKFALLIAGTRSYTDYDTVRKTADYLLQKQVTMRNILIVSGGATGADALAERYAKERGFELKIVPADWQKYGKSAGPRRNAVMHHIIEGYEHRACLCFWDGSSRGTAHNFELAKKGGTRLVVYNYTSKSFVQP